MKFLRRVLGGDGDAGTPDVAPINPSEIDASEREHELDVLRDEQERLDELAQRQLKYANYAWTPPPQGGERRADDTDEPSKNG